MTSLIIVLGLMVAIQSMLIALLWLNMKELETEDQRLNYKFNTLHESVVVMETVLNNKIELIIEQQYKNVNHKPPIGPKISVLQTSKKSS